MSLSRETVAKLEAIAEPPHPISPDTVYVRVTIVVIMWYFVMVGGLLYRCFD